MFIQCRVDGVLGTSFARLELIREVPRHVPEHVIGTGLGDRADDVKFRLPLRRRIPGPKYVRGSN